MAGHLPIWFLHFLYPAKEPNFVRDRPLQVLALGLGRTGTESLALALEELGYGDVYHGWKTAEYPGCFVQWTRFGIAKFSDHEKDPSIFTALEFDKAIGHCGAITDLPAIAFGPELLRAYPNAKVVLNRRADLDAWYESQKTTVDTLHRDWLTVLRSLFDNDLFWVWQGIRWGPRKLARGNFEQYGRAMYHDHYAQLEAECRKQGREYLDWTVQDGWEPLCRFLGKPVPDHAFPNENAAGGFAVKAHQVLKQLHQRANRNIAITSVMALAMITGGLAWFAELDIPQVALW